VRRSLLLGALLLLPLFLAAGCGHDRERAAVLATGGDPERGRVVVLRYGCEACHDIPGVAGARGEVGPPLDGVASRVYLAGRLANTPRNLIYFLRAPQAVLPHGAMPDLGVSERDGRDMAAYLYTLR
jgi:cytochrome c